MLCIELYDFLVRLAVTLVHLGFVQWMSVEDVSSLILIVRYATAMSTSVLGNSMIWHLIDHSVLDLRSFHDDRLVLCFILGYERSIVDSLDGTHILRPVKLVRIVQIHFFRQGSLSAHLLRVGVTLPVILSFDNKISLQYLLLGTTVLHVRSRGKLCPLVMLQIVQLDLPDVGTCDI